MRGEGGRVRERDRQTDRQTAQGEAARGRGVLGADNELTCAQESVESQSEEEA